MSVTLEKDYPFAPKPQPTLKPGEFVFSAMYYYHAHLTGMVGGLINAGATLKSFYDPDPKKVEEFVRCFPNVHVAQSEEEILNDPEVRLVAAAAITNQRAEIGCRVMRAGKDYWTDKAPMTELAHVEMARECVKETGKKYIRWTGYRSGQRIETPEQIRAKHADRLVREAVWGMMPKGRLGRAQYAKLKVYVGAEHPHAAQKPEPVK